MYSHTFHSWFTDFSDIRKGFGIRSVLEHIILLAIFYGYQAIQNSGMLLYFELWKIDGKDAILKCLRLILVAYFSVAWANWRKMRMF